MTNIIWTEVDFRLSVVNRWQVMPTIRRQSVAEHQHNVAVLAERLATDVFHIKDFFILYRVTQYALRHDKLEAIIGDPPSYTKPYINEDAMSAEFADMLRDEDYDTPAPIVKKIVKCADFIDAAVFLRVEISMGNKTVVGVLRDLEDRFRTFCLEEGTSNVYVEYERVVDGMFGGNGQLTIEGFRFK